MSAYKSKTTSNKQNHDYNDEPKIVGRMNRTMDE